MISVFFSCFDGAGLRNDGGDAGNLASPTRRLSLTTTQAPTGPTAATAAPPEGSAVARTTSRNMTGTGNMPAAINVSWPDAGPSRVVTADTRHVSSHAQSVSVARVRSRNDSNENENDNKADIQPSLSFSSSPHPSPYPSPRTPNHPVPLATTTKTTSVAPITSATNTSLQSSMSKGSFSSTDSRCSVSHGPESSEIEGRISISSTVYPASSVNHSYDSHFSYHQFQSSRPSMTSTSPDHESFMDFASPVSSPRSPEFARDGGPTHERVTSIYSTTSFNVNPNLYKPKSKELPSLYIPAPSKPPLPTTPKPDFSRRSHSAQPHEHRSSSADVFPRAHTPVHVRPSQTLPPTTTFLNPRERADRVRQNRKLTQVFGQTPGNIEAIAFSQTAYEANVPSLSASSNQSSSFGGKRKHQRGAVSVSLTEDPPASASGSSRAVWPPPEGTMYLSLSGVRRHSSPLTTQEFTLPDIETVTAQWNDVSRSPSPVRDTSDLIEVGSEEGVPHSDWSSHAGHTSVRKAGVVSPGSPTSFMDLSDEEGPGDAHSIISLETPKATRRRGNAPFSPSTPSISESLSTEEQAEEDRRRKRDKVARLHRFLGSRIPTDLVLAQVDAQPSTPPSGSATEKMSRDVGLRKVRIRRRRSSSAAELGGTWSDDIDRLKEDLNEREKAINVRRAVKMEKVCYLVFSRRIFRLSHTVF